MTLNPEIISYRPRSVVTYFTDVLLIAETLQSTLMPCFITCELTQEVYDTWIDSSTRGRWKTEHRECLASGDSQVPVSVI